MKLRFHHLFSIISLRSSPRSKSTIQLFQFFFLAHLVSGVLCFFHPTSISPDVFPEKTLQSALDLHPGSLNGTHVVGGSNNAYVCCTSSHNHGSQEWVPPIVVTFQI